MSILIFAIIFYVLLSISLYYLFPKLNIESWKGLVPVLNFVELGEKTGRARWYGLLVLVPIVNIFIATGIAVATVRSFGRYSLAEAALAVIYCPISFFRLAFDKDAEYKGPILTHEKEYLTKLQEAKKSGHERKFKKLADSNPYHKNGLREWFESIVFAVFAAAFIRMFFIEAYVIPTPSMEGSLLVGDFLFVSKSSYGIRTPQTVAMIPLLHNRVPMIGGESYFKKPSLPYYRLPAIREIKRNDPIVFNWPPGDSVFITDKRSYYVSQVKREPAFVAFDPALRKKLDDEDYVIRPMDKKDHYIKRAVGIPGDSLQIINGQIYINGAISEDGEHVQYQYQVLNASGINRKRMEEWGIDASDAWGSAGSGGYFLDDTQAENLRSTDPNIIVRKVIHQAEPLKLFPHDPQNNPGWSVDNYGPVWIPKAGETIALDAQNLKMYNRVISVYEGNQLEVKDGQVFINGQAKDSYTFKQDYYWAMGDNRHNSEDSRMWGFVPHDHLVGKPLFIWFSTKNGSIGQGIRWNRLFKSASNI